MASASMEGLHPILVIEDNTDDLDLARMALLRGKVENPVVSVADGSEAVDYLLGTGKFSNRAEYPIPCFIILDLKMPAMDGFEFLRWVQDHPTFRCIPTVVFSCSMVEQDISRAYQLGAHSVIKKPVDFSNLIKIVRAGHLYWSRVSRTEA